MIDRTCINCGGTQFQDGRDKDHRPVRICRDCGWEAVFMLGERIEEVKTDDGGPEAEIPGAF